MIENVTDLRDRVLKPGGRILPNRFEVFLEPVQLQEEFRVPFIWEMDVHGIRFESLRPDRIAASNHRGFLQHESWRFIRPFEVERLLCDPRPLMTFDLETMAADYAPEPIVVQKRMLDDGCVDGLLLYFNAYFDDDNVISTTPLNVETNWLPSLRRLERQPLVAGSLVDFTLHVPDVRDYRAWELDWRTGV
ncbi:MAG: hypothetical protein KF861_08090 [Planctomycetaceae bacterium]|nr:hypothetical protein [Planctomycetaceae bacterium]